MIVMDIGASYRGYAADVTRTVPADGTFSDVQRDIYSAVRAAQAAAEAAAKVNGPARALTDAANASLDASLAKLGLIEAAGATYDCDAAATRQCTQRSLYYMHSLGHGIGLDVHDPGAATDCRQSRSGKRVHDRARHLRSRRIFSTSSRRRRRIRR